MTVGVRTLTLAVIMMITLALNLAPALAQDPVNPPPASGSINGLTHYYQTWNNCGGANLTMAMSYYGWGSDQDVARSWLKPNIEDKNVSPGQMTAFVNEQSGLGNVRAIWRYGGDLDVDHDQARATAKVTIEELVEIGYAVTAMINTYDHLKTRSQL